MQQNNCCTITGGKTRTNWEIYKQLSYRRETALQGALVLAKSGRLELGDTGFVQVRENWKRSGNLSGQGKSGKMQKWLESQGNLGGGQFLPFCTAVVMLIIVELESSPPCC